MVWEPFALAVLFGLLISAGIYFIVMWPQVAPDDDVDDETAALADADAAEAPTSAETAAAETAAATSAETAAATSAETAAAASAETAAS